MATVTEMRPHRPCFFRGELLIQIFPETSQDIVTTHDASFLT
jgi:hypothetical protein